MCDVIAHRGPDDFGLLLDGPAGLGHRRLSIVDLPAGRQPMANEDQTVHITFNGEIYNHAEFRATLESRGHVFRTLCDTEAIVHLYEEYGTDCVQHLRGMFAFGIWDGRLRQMFLARDRLGIKPLYYHHAADGSLYFASEIKALLVAGVRAEFNEAALPDYLANHATSDEQTLFRGIKRLEAGQLLVWRDGQLATRTYWDLHYGNDESAAARGNGVRDDHELIHEWGERFQESVRLHTMADVPVGVFLSGGIDSSAITAAMSRLDRGPVKTFAVGFDEPEANELGYARLVAGHFQTDHHEILVQPDEFFAALPKMVWHEDEPPAGAASVALYFVSKLASEHVRVVLTGEGSDELLGGYARYRKSIYNLALGRAYHAALPSTLRNWLGRCADGMPLQSRLRQKLQRTFVCLPADFDTLYFDNFSVFSRAAQQRLLTDDFKDRVRLDNPYSQARDYFGRADSDALLNRMLYADVKTCLQELLMKQDQMSMATSVESRVPFLDHPLVEFTAKLPVHLKLRYGWITKYVLRRAMAGVLPESILSRRKMGFPVPIGRWFRGAFRGVIDEYVLGGRALGRGLFDADFVRQLVARHQAGENHAERLWSLLTLEMWLRRFIDGDQSHHAPVPRPGHVVTHAPRRSYEVIAT